MMSRSRVIASVTIAIAVLLVSVAVVGYMLNHNVPARYADAADRFKYASMGTESVGIPTMIYKIMPRLCSDTLPRGKMGYEAFGFIYEPGHDLPIGTSERTLAVPRVGYNCGLCHIGTVRDTPTSKPRLVLGMPNTQFDLVSYLTFSMACLTGPRFTTDNVMSLLETYNLSILDRVFYRSVVIPRTQAIARVQLESTRWPGRRPPAGPGRGDAFNMGRQLLHLNPNDDDLIGTVDYPSLWNQRARVDRLAHWDGNNPSQFERNRIAMMFVGAQPDSLDVDELDWMREWLLTLPVPPYPYPVDRQLAARGEPIFRDNCAHCHGADAAGRVTPIEEVATDRERLDMITPNYVALLNTITATRWQLRSFRKTNGYVSALLDGIWARAPYLHNGSIPNLRALLEPGPNRPKVFYRGYDVYDRENVGFVSDGPDVTEYFRFDTALPGNRNIGHEYGTDLPPDEKKALLEYLKTL